MPEVNSGNGPAYVDGPPYALGESGRTHEREIDTRGPDFLRGGQDRRDNAPIVHPRRTAEDQDYEEVRRDFPPPQGPRYINPIPTPPDRIAQTPPPVEHRRTRARSREVDDVVWDVSRTKDVTIHFELDITEDLEPDLDEFCRLARLGNFQGAKQFFQDNLEQYIDNPYIFVQYAQMLMAMGDYQSVEALKVPYDLENSEHLRLLMNWELIKLFTASHTEGLPEEDEPLTPEEAAVANAFEELAVKFEQLKAKKGEATLEDNIKNDAGSQLGSTECQILSLAIRIEARLQPDEPCIEKLDLTKIYEILLRQGRIWDFRDIFIGAVHSCGSTGAFEKFFPSSEIPLDRILLDWSTTLYDESTNLALLDILISVALRRIPSPRKIAGTRLLVDEAGLFASNIVQRHPSNLKSRQYIRWILAKVALTNYQDIHSSNELSNLPGLFFSEIRVVELPIYVPAALETPDWQLLRRPSNSSETLQTALKAARQLGDLETEVLCLTQLILHSEEPADLFEDLINLQKTMQNDIRSLLKTCLSKYLICRDKESRDALREEILSIGDDFKTHPDLRWAKKMVLRALAHSKDEADMLLDEVRDFPHRFSRLSRSIREFMKRNNLERESGHLHPSVYGEDYLPRAAELEQYLKRKEKKKAERERERKRYEEEELPSTSYYERDYHDDDYSPSPPHASGGAYYPENIQFPPPPPSTIPTSKPVNRKEAPVPPYNPADYTEIPQQPDDPYSYAPAKATGDNASVEKQTRLNSAHKVSSEREDTARNASLEETRPEIPNFRRPPLVTVSSMKEGED